MAGVLALAIALMLAPGKPAPPVELRWEAPSECPTRARVMDRIAVYVASEPSELSAVRAIGRIRAVGEQTWTLSLQVRTAGGREEIRELTDTTCEGLAEVAALWIAIAVSPVVADPGDKDPEPVPTGAAEIRPRPSAASHVDASKPGDSATPRGESTPAEDRETRGVVAPRTDRSSRDRRRRRVTRERNAAPRRGANPPRARADRPQLSARIRAGGGIGHHPLSGELSGGGAVAWRVLRLELIGRYATPRRITIDDDAEIGARISMWSVGANACASLRDGSRVRFPLCGGAEFGQLLGNGFGLDNERRDRPLWIAATASPSVRVGLGARVALWGSPELVIAIARPELRVGGVTDPLFAATPVGGRLLFGAEFVLW